MRNSARKNKNKEKVPLKPGNFAKVNSSGREERLQQNQDELLRFNIIGNRARRSFNNDMPGGGYEGF